MRLFAGTLLDDRSQLAYERFVSELVASHHGILRGVPSRTFHITYAFMAHAPEDVVESLAAAVAAAVRRHRRLTISLDVPHVIGPPQRPRLVTASVGTGRESLGRLADAVVGAIGHACPEAEAKPTRSLHVTLARFGRSARRQDARTVAEWAGHRARPASDIPIERIQLIRSELGGSAPVYTILRDVPIGE